MTQLKQGIADKDQTKANGNWSMLILISKMHTTMR